MQDSALSPNLLLHVSSNMHGAFALQSKANAQ